MNLKLCFFLLKLFYDTYFYAFKAIAFSSPMGMKNVCASEMRRVILGLGRRRSALQVGAYFGMSFDVFLDCAHVRIGVERLRIDLEDVEHRVVQVNVGPGEVVADRVALGAAVHADELLECGQVLVAELGESRHGTLALLGSKYRDEVDLARVAAEDLRQIVQTVDQRVDLEVVEVVLAAQAEALGHEARDGHALRHLRLTIDYYVRHAASR